MRTGFIVKLVLAMLLLVALMPKSCAQVMLPHRHAIGGGSVLTPPIDVLTNAPYSAYSVARKLWSSYAGAAFRVSHEDGVSEANIGFSGNLVDTAALQAFAAGHSCYITNLYDQSGNARDLDVVPAIVTNRLQVVTNGTLMVDANGHLWAHMKDGLLSYAKRTTTISSNVISGFIVFEANANTATRNIFTQASTVSSALRQAASPTRINLSSGAVLTGPSYSTGVPYLISWFVDSAGDDFIQLNQGATITGDAGSNTTGPITIGYDGAATSADSNFQELFIWGTAVGAGDYSALQSSINGFYQLW